MTLRPILAALTCTFLLPWPDATLAAPYRPSSDDQVLERLPAAAAGPRKAELAAARRALARDPKQVALAVDLVDRYLAETAAEGDPRYLGYAQAALAPWWTQPAPPPPVRVKRAVLMQYSHQFEPALADLSAVLQAEPENAEAWAWTAAIALVQARYPLARQACERVAPLVSDLNAAACAASVDAVTGRGAAAVRAIEEALAEEPEAEPAERLWALTRLAETHERLGADAPAEAAFRQALALGIADVYLLAAYSDFLLDRGRPAEVLALLRDKTRADVLLLRQALAARAARDAALPEALAALAARFDAARLRGDTVHQKEEARYALALLDDPARALPLAVANFRLQREPADARLLLEAALAARRRDAAEPALAWLRESGIESRVLRALAARVEALK